jgi:hypothetical protein
MFAGCVQKITQYMDAVSFHQMSRKLVVGNHYYSRYIGGWPQQRVYDSWFMSTNLHTILTSAVFVRRDTHIHAYNLSIKGGRRCSHSAACIVHSP